MKLGFLLDACLGMFGWGALMGIGSGNVRVASVMGCCVGYYVSACFW